LINNAAKSPLLIIQRRREESDAGIGVMVFVQDSQHYLIFRYYCRW